MQETHLGIKVKKWCERGDLNPHGYPQDPKSCASAIPPLSRITPYQNYETTLSVELNELLAQLRQDMKSNLFIIKGLSRTGHPQIQSIPDEDEIKSDLPIQTAPT